MRVHKELVPLARKYLCIAATSASSKRVLSKADRLLSIGGTPKTVQMVLFLNQNHALLWGEDGERKSHDELQ